jgi:type III secretory pathway component EscU
MIIETIIGFLKDVLKIFLTMFIQMLIASCIGTGAAAIACWIYDAPMVFSLFGGMVTLGTLLAFIWLTRLDF